MKVPRKYRRSHYWLIVSIFAFFLNLTGIVNATESITLRLESADLNINTDLRGNPSLGIDAHYSRGKPGAPMLPQRHVDVALPADTDLNSLKLEIVDQTILEITDRCDVQPAPPEGTIDKDGKPVYLWHGAKQIVDGRDMSIYTRNAFYPESNLALASTGQLRKWKYARIQFTPVSVNPVTKQLKQVIRADIRINFKKAIPGPSKEILFDTVMDDMARDNFINFDEAVSWYTPSGEKSKSTDYDYVIITTNDIESCSLKLDDFVQHKESRGLSVMLITEDEYGGLTGPSPNGRAEKIRQWLIDNYIIHDIMHVLLIGDPRVDSNGVPMKAAWQERDGGPFMIPTDLYYSDLTGDWDLNDDDMYGHYPEDWEAGGVDVTPEVYVGRIPVYSNCDHLDSILQKTMDYQNASGDISWRDKILLPECFSDSITDAAYMSQHMITDYLISSGIDYYRMYSQGTCIDDSIHTSEEELLHDSTALHWQNNPYGLVTYWAHGSSTGVGIGYTDDDEEGHHCGNLFNIWNPPGLDNTRPAIMFQCTCLNGHPETTNNLGYTLLQSGAVTTVAASRVSLYSPGWTQPTNSNTNGDNAYEYMRNIVQRSFSTGHALAALRYELNLHRWNSFTYYMLGDPEIHLHDNNDYVDYYVDKTNGSDLNDGLTWSTAFSTIQHAVDLCNVAQYSFDRIYVAAETYYENIEMNGDLRMLGGYPPGGGDRDPFEFETVINGSDSGRGISIYVDDNVWIDGFTVTDSDGIGIGASDNIIISQCRITGNQGIYGYGGGMTCVNSSVELRFCRFDSNWAANFGGGIMIEDADMTLTNCLIYGNSAQEGGGIYYMESDLIFENCSIVDNWASVSSGGIHGTSGVTTLTNSIVWGNAPDSMNGAMAAAYSDIEGGWAGSSNIDADPLFATGEGGAYYIAHTETGHPLNSPCRGAGSAGSYTFCMQFPDNGLCLNDLTTRIDDVNDQYTVDLGYHYPRLLQLASPTPTPTITATPSNTPTHSPTPTSTPSPRILKVPTYYSTIQDAIDDANNFDTVLVADGIYTGIGNKDLDLLGKNIVVCSELGPENCIIDCENNGRGFNLTQGEPESALIRGFTIRNGLADASPDLDGGGIYAEYTDMTIMDCRIENNEAYSGGGVSCKYADLSLVRLIVTGNIGDLGGGINAVHSAVIISDCDISGNTANSGAGIRFVSVSAADVTNCVITGNTSTLSGGGGVICIDSSPVVGNCLFTQNAADEGAGLYASGSSSPMVKNCTFTENIAVTSGGSIFAHTNSAPVIILSISWGNSAGDDNEIGIDNASIDVSYSDVELVSGTYPGMGNINSDPQFVEGSGGNYYLDYRYWNISPCADAGASNPIYVCVNDYQSDLCMHQVSTRSDSRPDTYLVDMGYHYSRVHFVPDSYPSIQAAIDAAKWGDTVLVADGTYQGYGNKNLTFHGKDLTVKSIHGKNNCLIDCQDSGRGVIFENGESQNTIIEGFTISAGNVPDFGGGMAVMNASPVIRDCLFSGNNAENGGGLYIIGGNPTVSDCYFGFNQANNNGGGLLIEHANDSTIISGCQFSFNSALRTGGLLCEGSDISVMDCMFNDNSAMMHSGGIYLHDSNALVTRCEFINNESTGVASDGGGLFALVYEELHISDCIFIGNSSSNNGGGMGFAGGNIAYVTNCLVKGNTATNGGGGISVRYSEPIFRNCTIVENTTSGDGGGLFLESTDSTFTDCILWDNTPDSVHEEGTGSPVLTYCDIQQGSGTYPGTGNINEDPLFITGPAGEYYLNDSSGNPCVDAGSNPAANICYTSDTGDVCMSELTTITQETSDTGIVDMGLHYRFGNVIHVPGDYSTIQSAMDASGDGDTVLVADGTYTGEGNKDLDFHGTPMTVKSVNGPQTCVIDCENTLRGFSVDSGEGPYSIIEGFTILNGNGGIGSAIKCESTSPTITNCIIRSCYSIAKAGGIYCKNSANPTISNCLFESNTSDFEGGAIYCYQSAPQIINCAFTQNTGEGGAISMDSCVPAPDIRNCTFYQNTSTISGGGAIYCVYSDPTVTDCILWDNSSSEIYTDNADPVITYCNIDGGFSGTGNINTDPRFETGPIGNFYLNNTGTPNPCRNAGSAPSTDICFLMGKSTVCMDQMVTSIYGSSDTSTVDMGVHYPLPDVLHVPTEYASLQAAIDASSHGDIVMIADGTYSGSGFHTIDFNGKLIRVSSENGPDTCTINLGASPGFFFQSGENEYSILDGITITDGQAQESVGIYIQQSSPTIRNCRISYNDATDYGGGGVGIHGYSSPVFFNCEISFNSAISGAGIYINQSSPVFFNCLLTNNAASNNGGAFFCDNCTVPPELYNCTLSGNSAASLGGGIFCSSSDTIVKNCIFWGDSGGEVATMSCFPAITYSDIMGSYPHVSNIDSDPEFVSGLSGDYYLDFNARIVSPCIDSGSDSAANIQISAAFYTVAMGELTTRMDAMMDMGIVDMGYHYWNDNVVTPTATLEPTLTPTNTPRPTITPTPSPRPTNTPQADPQILRVPYDYATIQAAVDAARDIDMVKVYDGTYTGVGNKEINFNGKPIKVMSQSGPFHCIIDLQGSRCAFVFDSGEGPSSVIQGFTIQNGYSTTPGGGIYCYQSSPAIENCVFDNNDSDVNGGAIACANYASPTIMNCLFHHNTSSGTGGAVFLDRNCDPVIKNATFNDNYATVSGSGLYCKNSSSPYVSNCIFWGDISDEIGFSADSSPSITYCDVEGGFTGAGNIDLDPLFSSGTFGNFYLRDSHTETSPCFDTGHGMSAFICFNNWSGETCMDDLTTKQIGDRDDGIVDMGFHYPRLTPTATPEPTNTPRPTNTPLPAVCPMDAMYSQPFDPYDPDVTAFGSDPDYDPGYETIAYEFFSTPEDICTVQWWGFTRYGIESIFLITFYDDDHGEPGLEFDSRQGTAICHPTEFSLYGETVNLYSLEMIPCVDIRDGWISIQGRETGNEIYFMWATSYDGDDQLYHEYRGALTEYPNDLSLCLEGMGPTPEPTATPTPTETPECLHHGDVDFNMEITAGDSQLAFLITLELYLPTFEEECAADCNDDGAVTAGDAQIIFNAVFGLDSCVDPI